MSALTRVFVVLLVVVSLLLSAGVVVFVNQVQDYRGAADSALAAVEAERQLRQTELAAATNERDEQARLRSIAQQQLASREETIAQLQKQVIDKNVELANANKNLSTQQVALTASTEATRAAQEQATRLTENQTAMRNTLNETLARNVDLNQRNNELTNQLDATEQERKFLAEQLAQAQQASANYLALLNDHNIDPSRAQGGLRAGAPMIRGVVTEKRVIAGTPYAVISVGSSDGVQKGMEFRVIDRQNASFLGTLIVEAVDANEATGRLAGPRIDQIDRQSEVTTQVRG